MFWQSIEGSDNAADYQAYITTYPMGQFVELARVRMMTLAQAERQPAPPPTDVAALTPAEQSSAGEPLTASDREGTWTASDNEWTITINIEGSSVNGKIEKQGVSLRLRGELQPDSQFEASAKRIGWARRSLYGKFPNITMFYGGGGLGGATFALHRIE